MILDGIYLWILEFKKLINVLDFFEKVLNIFFKKKTSKINILNSEKSCNYLSQLSFKSNLFLKKYTIVNIPNSPRHYH